MASQAIFSDLDFNFTQHPVTEDVALKTNVAAIKQSLRNLILTKNYERPFNGNLGSPVNSLLFEPFSPMLRIMLVKSIEQLVENYEPRIQLEDVIIILDEDSYSVEINIYYKILNTSTLQQFDLILKRTR
jgi:hypothetical protein